MVGCSRNEVREAREKKIQNWQTEISRLAEQRQNHASLGALNVIGRVQEP